MLRVADLFAGLGGFSQAAQQAGLRVVWAGNHWPAAVQCHALNHPSTAHDCQDLQQKDWSQLPEYDILTGSPCCQGHSRGRKEGPQHDASRSTAWAIVSALEASKAGIAIVENVPEFRRWSLYPVWREALRTLGYAVSEVILDAANFGVPQNRVRLFLVATRSRAPLELRFHGQEHRSARGIIDWESYPWTKVERPGRAQATLDRVKAGRRQLGDRFVMPYYSGGSGLKGRSLDRPLGTVTTRDRWAVVSGDEMRMLQPRELARAMSFPDACQLPTHSRSLAVHLLGNAVCPGQGEAVIRAAMEAT